MISAPAMAQMGFSIAVDGEYVAGDPRPNIEPRRTDVSLAATDIQLTYDGLGGEQRLAVGLVSAIAGPGGGASLSFALDTNYGQWIERAELRAFAPGVAAPVAIVPFDKGRAGLVLAPDFGHGELVYLARVYDADGRYDETQAFTFDLDEIAAAGTVQGRSVYAGDNTGNRSIPVHGGTVTVSGADLPQGAQVRVLGESVPVDRTGRFAIDRILPSGDHVIDVAIVAPDGQTTIFRRDINIPTSEWFYVGLADLTVGTRWGDGKLVDAAPEEFDDLYVKGRASFYLKGKIRGEYLLTAAGNTGEGPLEDMFRGVLSTDPQAVLRRIDPNQYYPVYGDDSVLVDDAPTSGKLYVRLERGPSHVMWGNFRTEIGDSSLLRAQRSLYGASGHYESDVVTDKGDPRYRGTVYFAQPGTLPATDILRGTGGSAYVLRRQDVAPGSEIVRIETVNAVTGTVTESRLLRPGVDYSINYMQGLVILAQPLASLAPSSGAVQSSEADYANLTVQYEYSPAGFEPEDYAFGASGSAWLHDSVRIGATAVSETGTSGDDISVVGVNARVEASAETFIEGEVLRSSGQGRSDWLSTDGGFTYVQQPAARPADEAFAYRVRAQANLADLLDSSFDAVGGIVVEGREAGFSTLGQQSVHDTFLVSAWLDAALSEDLELGLDIDHIENASGMQRTEAGAEIRYRLNEDLSVSAGLIHRETSRPGGSDKDNGSRTDIGARVAYQPYEYLTLHAFGQVTAHASAGYGRNDRVGLGAEWQIDEHWALGAEGSIGTTGPQALATISHSPAPGERTYLGFRVAPDARDDFFTQTRPINGLVAGGERRLNEAVSVHAENTYGLFSDDGRMSSLYGIDFAPDQAWSASATYETGRIDDALSGDLERHALSAGLSYVEDGIEWTSRGEVRIETSDDGSRDRNTFLGQTGLSVQTNDDWRALAGVSALVSQSDQSSILDGDYIEATLGGAYRPVNNDRLNALIRYTYLYDLPGPDQVSRNGSVLGPAQRSHIFSVDANYDVTEHLTIGGKYGFRVGEISESRLVRDFESSSMHLFVLRADLGIITDWRLLLEARGLYQPETQNFNAGALAMLSYDINDVVRLGVGYNFGNFTDDLRDLSYDHQGIFLNLSARF
ncbi:MAG TPA: TonB-dependent receptor [Pelagibacterium sp.]|uniref:TonB-dependent receptor n=1 Tax=Pelagibacterium sp. TaxID=1967288 RepID=UPI002B9BDBF2|nr:TonB-dependent receptor [Pelagibacterium sp.]HWJ87346.1 TonB-dependent receptor [Pelagibacterium sp.]